MVSTKIKAKKMIIIVIFVVVVIGILYNISNSVNSKKLLQIYFIIAKIVLYLNFKN